ncbi:hypothetical protein [Flavobacterium sp. XS2P14]|uniref:hypothetical protein n=1 Tax=Flavobacterium sp. XS2P14 TaxID=3401735 RepID=UPI003AAE0FFB
MVDYIKLSTKDKSIIEYFRKDKRLEWCSSEDKFNRYDPEVIITKDKYQYKGIIFCFYPNELKISFFPHYSHNDNLHNANDFRVKDCINVILEFKNTFKIDWEKLRIINLEFGVNVVSPIDIKDLISFLAYHNQNEFKTDIQYTYSKKSYHINKRSGRPNDYKIIKAYAKGIQFSDYCDIDTFRFEIKSDQSKYINKLGIFTLNDLLKVDVYERFSDNLINEFKDVLLLNVNDDDSNLTTKEQSTLKKYLHPNFWYRIKQDNQRNRFNKEKTKYYKLLDKTGNHLKKQLEKIIYDKLEYLKSGAVSTPNKNIKSGAVSSIIYSGIGTQYKNAICKVTGLDISTQKRQHFIKSFRIKH